METQLVLKQDHDSFPSVEQCFLLPRQAYKGIAAIYIKTTWINLSLSGLF